MGLMLAATPVWAASDDLLVERDGPWVSYDALGWSFLGLSAASLAVAVNGYQESQAALDKARDAYDNYEVATTEADALHWRDETEKFHDRAKAFESTANTALFLTVLFGFTSYYSFSPEDEPSGPTVTVTATGVRFRTRF